MDSPDLVNKKLCRDQTFLNGQRHFGKSRVNHPWDLFSFQAPLHDSSNLLRFCGIRHDIYLARVWKNVQDQVLTSRKVAFHRQKHPLFHSWTQL